MPIKIKIRIVNSRCNIFFTPCILGDGGAISSCGYNGGTAEVVEPPAPSCNYNGGSAELISPTPTATPTANPSSSPTSSPTASPTPSPTSEFSCAYAGGTAELIEPTPSPTASPTLLQCGQNNSFNGGLSFPSTENIYLGVDTGYVVLDFNAVGIPDKFIVTFDGVEVINTGYRGDSSIQGMQEALTNNLVNVRFLPDETIVGIGLGSAYFYKNSAITTATVEVYAPLDGTAWTYTLNCPVAEEPTSSPTSAPTASPTASPSASPTATPTSSPTPTTTPSPTASATPTVTPTVSPTPTPS